MAEHQALPNAISSPPLIDLTHQQLTDDDLRQQISSNSTFSLQGIISISLRRNRLRSVPFHFLSSSADTLKVLDLYDNGIESIHPLDDSISLKHFQVLCSLDLSFNRLASLDAAELPSSLEQLYVASNPMKGQLSNLHMLDNLKILEMGKCRLKDAFDLSTLPKEFLEELYLTANSIKKLDNGPHKKKDVFCFKRLRILALQFNKFDVQEMARLNLALLAPNLKELYLGDNRLGGKLKVKIVDIDTSDDNDESFDPNCSPLRLSKTLNLLDLSNNQLTSLYISTPIAEDKLIGLSELWLHGNQIKTIEDLQCATHVPLKNITFRGNPLGVDELVAHKLLKQVLPSLECIDEE